MSTVTESGIRCGNHGRERVFHASVADVRACCTGAKAPAPASEVAPEPPQAVSIRRFGANWDTIPVGGSGNGYYAIEEEDRVRFFRVQRPTEGKWAGRTFIMEQAGDNYFPIEPLTRAFSYLTTIARDPQSAGLLYAEKMTRCTRCNHSLTDAESRARGMGPDCAAKGW